jgi:hypothetical protein
MGHREWRTVMARWFEHFMEGRAFPEDTPEWLSMDHAGTAHCRVDWLLGSTYGQLNPVTEHLRTKADARPQVPPGGRHVTYVITVYGEEPASIPGGPLPDDVLLQYAPHQTKASPSAQQRLWGYYPIAINQLRRCWMRTPFRSSI